MKARKIIFSTLFMLLMLGLRAQDKYEYASVIYNTYYPKKVFVSIGSENKMVDAGDNPKELFPGQNLTNIIGIINKMAQEGWEVYTNNVSVNPTMNSSSLSVYYFLRRKKN